MTHVLLALALAVATPAARPEVGASSQADASQQPDIERLQSIERTLKWSTAGSLLVTAGLGTVTALNVPTLLSPGRCATGNPILGTYGCDRGLSTLHGISGVLSLTLYTANNVLALSLPGPVGNVSDAERPWHRALTYTALVGIVVQPLLGLFASFPQVIGIPPDTQAQFSRTTRSVHITVGYITVAAFIGTLVLEF
ncbi:MAG: hypothetical protein L0Y66_01730 [Myxococcaceae bacterium]|nr:hypothetical protein [Myxococcaceae bacterium]MCI0670141.1 hypothetical protein [Myxococcaceae bacterium]